MAVENVKSFLDQIGYLMLRDNATGIMSEKTEMARKETELPVSCCPGPIQALFYGEGNGDETLGDPGEYCKMPRDRQMARAKEKALPKRKKKELTVSTRAKRIDQIKRELPGGVFTFVPIDTENVFLHTGEKYQLDMDVAEYKPRMFRGEMMYSMDTVVVVSHEGALHFFNMDYLPIDRQLVQTIPM